MSWAFGDKARVARCIYDLCITEVWRAHRHRAYGWCECGSGMNTLRSNDRWFQHIAIVVSDMRCAYERLRDAHVEQISSGPQRLPDWNVNAAEKDNCLAHRDTSARPIITELQSADR